MDGGSMVTRTTVSLTVEIFKQLFDVACWTVPGNGRTLVRVAGRDTRPTCARGLAGRSSKVVVPQAFPEFDTPDAERVELARESGWSYGRPLDVVVTPM